MHEHGLGFTISCYSRRHAPLAIPAAVSTMDFGRCQIIARVPRRLL